MSDHQHAAAIAAIKEKLGRLLREADDIANKIAELRTREREISLLLEDCQAAARFFGAEQEIAQFKSDMVPLVYRGPPAVEIPLYGKVGDRPPKGSDREAIGSIRELVIQSLRDAGGRGTKASPIRLWVQSLTGRQLHEKTIGMTLYRLAKDGLARREGLTWFFVPPSAETKNPGADNAGAQ